MEKKRVNRKTNTTKKTTNKINTNKKTVDDSLDAIFDENINIIKSRKPTVKKEVVTKKVTEKQEVRPVIKKNHNFEFRF